MFFAIKDRSTYSDQSIRLAEELRNIEGTGTFKNTYSIVVADDSGNSRAIHVRAWKLDRGITPHILLYPTKEITDGTIPTKVPLDALSQEMINEIMNSRQDDETEGRPNCFMRIKKLLSPRGNQR